MISTRQIRLAGKPLLHLACSLPLVLLILTITETAGLRLGPNPQLYIRDVLGEWGLRLLLLTLAITPLRRLTGKSWLHMFRRPLGLWAFAYVSLHFVTYFFLDRSLDLAIIAEDILKRPYITLGLAGFMLMVPLAITSTAGWQRRLGKHWLQLHRLIYPIAILGCWHFYWLVKKDLREPLLYCGLLAILLASRIWWAYGSKQRTA